MATTKMSGNGKRVLIAEDKATSRELLRNILEPRGYEIFEAIDGLDALGKASEHRPDLILLDLHMPQLNGMEVLAKLRADPRFRSTPVIALTASAMQGDREKALAAGFNSYLTKPVSLEVLRTEVSRYI